MAAKSKVEALLDEVKGEPVSKKNGASDGRQDVVPGLQYAWFKQAMDQAPETLYGFMVGLQGGYKHTSESYSLATAAMMLGAMAAFSRIAPEGVEPNQKTMMWSVIESMTGMVAQPLILRNFLAMLNPSSKNDFVTVPRGVFKRLVETAKQALAAAEKEEEDQQPPPETIEHWKKIASGTVPFGYRLGE